MSSKEQQRQQPEHHNPEHRKYKKTRVKIGPANESKLCGTGTTSRTNQAIEASGTNRAIEASGTNRAIEASGTNRAIEASATKRGPCGQSGGTSGTEKWIQGKTWLP
ncbi:uncharacterized protein LOC144037341 isoform X2 [Vanacampus margaritifer]